MGDLHPSVGRWTILKGCLAWNTVQIASPLPVFALGEQPVTLGMVEPFTGVYAELANAEVTGARLAQRRIRLTENMEYPRTNGFLNRACSPSPTRQTGAWLQY